MQLGMGLCSRCLNCFCDTVDWPKTYPLPKEPLHAVTNCNFAVEDAKQMGCVIVNIGGDDIYKGNRKLILGLSWQLMRMNIFQILSDVQLKGGTKVCCLAMQPVYSHAVMCIVQRSQCGS
jgi:hypothetical protein